jgi:translation initiation factor 4E
MSTEVNANSAGKNDKPKNPSKAAPAKSKLAQSLADKSVAEKTDGKDAAKEESSEQTSPATLTNDVANLSIKTNDSKSSEQSVTEAGETVITPDPADQKMYHPLHNKWTMWFNGPAATKAKGKDSQQHWQSNVKKIMDFDTVEAFWGLFNNLQPPSFLPNKSDYHIFKEGIRPEWEDKANEKGGSWKLEYQNKEELNRAWTYVVLAMIGEQFEDSDEICGAVVSIRPKRCRLALWTRNANNEQAQMRIGAGLKKHIEAGSIKIGFNLHEDQMNRSGFEAQPKYTV